jgi:hypothetical protein
MLVANNRRLEAAVLPVIQQHSGVVNIGCLLVDEKICLDGVADYVSATRK